MDLIDDAYGVESSHHGIGVIKRRQKKVRHPHKNSLATQKYSPKHMDKPYMWANTRREIPLPESRENQEFFEKKAEEKAMKETDAEYRGEWDSDSYYRGESDNDETKWADYTDEDDKEAGSWKEFLAEVGIGDVPGLGLCVICHNQVIDVYDVRCRFCWTT
jgi:hypothetical protein